MKNDSNPIIRSEEVTIDMHICAALSESRSSGEIYFAAIKDFDRYAKRYHIDYAIQKDLSCTPPRYLIFFKAQDTDALNAAFKEYSASVLSKTERPSVLAKLHNLAQTIANLPDKIRHKEEERGL